MRKSFIWRNLAQMLLNNGQFNSELAYKAKDAITQGLEQEDPEDAYTEDDKVTSAIVTVEDLFSGMTESAQEAQDLALNVLNQG